MNTLQATVRAYLAALEAGDTARVIALFAPDAWVLSPFLGRVPAASFFPQVVAASSSTRLTVHDVLLSAEGHPRAVGYFRYDWGLADGQQVSFECADVFDFAADGRIAMLTILYDTHPIRATVGDKYG